jgi:hypothetical protein
MPTDAGIEAKIGHTADAGGAAEAVYAAEACRA